MDNNLGWILDTLVFVIAAYVLFSNAKRGVTKVIVLCGGYILATLLSSVLSGLATPLLYETVARDNSLSTIETVNEKVDFAGIFADAIDNEHYGFNCDRKHIGKIITGENRAVFDQMLYQYVTDQTGSEPGTQEQFTVMLNRAFIEGYSAELHERTPRYVMWYFRRGAAEDPQMMRDFIALCGDSRNSAEVCAAFIEERYCQAPAQETLRIFLYLIFFSVMMVFAALISSSVQNRIFFNVTEKADHVFGGIVGLLEVAAMLVLLTIIVRLIVLLTGNQAGWCNEETIKTTGVFRLLYENFSLMI